MYNLLSVAKEISHLHYVWECTESSNILKIHIPTLKCIECFSRYQIIEKIYKLNLHYYLDKSALKKN